MNYSETGYKMARQLALDLHSQNHFRLQSLLLFGTTEDFYVLNYVASIYGLRKSWSLCVRNAQREPLSACLVNQLVLQHYGTSDQRLELFASLGMLEYMQHYLEQGATAYFEAAQGASRFGHPEALTLLMPHLDQRQMNICLSVATRANQPTIATLLAPHTGPRFRMTKLRMAVKYDHIEVAHALAASLGNPGLVLELIDQELTGQPQD